MNEKDKKIKPEDWKDKKENPVKEEIKNKSTGPYGWICPVCGRGLAPWVSVCGCVQPQVYTTPAIWSVWTGPNYYG